MKVTSYPLVTKRDVLLMKQHIAALKDKEPTVRLDLWLETIKPKHGNYSTPPAMTFAELRTLRDYADALSSRLDLDDSEREFWGKLGDHTHAMVRAIQEENRPGLRPLLPKMTEVSEHWAALLPRWAEVEASHLAEVGLGWTKASSAPRTYDLMASILRPARVAPFSDGRSPSAGAGSLAQRSGRC